MPADARWREPLHPDDDLHSTLERTQLVERIISLEAENRVLHRTIRDMAEWMGGDRSEGSYVIAQQARIVGLERNIEKLTGPAPRRDPDAEPCGACGHTCPLTERKVA